MPGIENFKTITFEKVKGSFSIPAGGAIDIHTANDLLRIRREQPARFKQMYDAARLGVGTLAARASIYGLIALPYQLLAEAIDNGFLTPDMWARYHHGQWYAYNPVHGFNYGGWPSGTPDVPADGWASLPHGIGMWGHPRIAGQQAVAAWNADRHTFDAAGSYAIVNGTDPDPGFANPTRTKSRVYSPVGSGRPQIAPELREAPALEETLPSRRLSPRQWSRIEALTKPLPLPQMMSFSGGRKKPREGFRRYRRSKRRDNKFIATPSQRIFVVSVFASLTEYEDAIDALYECLPSGAKALKIRYYGRRRHVYEYKPKDLSIQEKARRIWEHQVHLDIACAAEKLFINELKDRAFALVGRMTQVAMEVNPYYERPVGIQQGPAL